MLTQVDIYEQWQKEIDGGRVPASVQFFHVELSVALNARLKGARKKVQRKLTPNRRAITPIIKTLSSGTVESPEHGVKFHQGPGAQIITTKLNQTNAELAQHLFFLGNTPLLRSKPVFLRIT